MKHIAILALAVAGLFPAIAQVTPPTPTSTYTVRLVWNQHPDKSVTRFRLYSGPSLSALTNVTEVSTNQAQVSSVRPETVFAVSAINTAGLESELSDPFIFTRSQKPTGLRVDVSVRVEVAQ